MTPSQTGTLLPALKTAIPGPRSEALVDVLARHECPAITARRARRAAKMGRASNDPVVWRSAVGANVWDADGNRFVDLTSGFGVALIGHRDPEVVAAARTQADRLLHAMGDAYPDETRVHLLEKLASVAPHGISHAILGLSGADAVGGAVKTAVLATGRPGVLTFRGGYHGLSLGTVPLQAYKAAFSDPFAGITNPHVEHLPFEAELDAVERILEGGTIGLVLIEPIQGRGGIRVASHDWIRAVSERAHHHGALVAYDEVQCGLGRTGDVWAGPGNPADGEPVVDLLCVGKQLGGGFPISATMGTAAVMNAWGASAGEALHTQTFLGHPMGCATALVVLDRLASICEAATDRGARLVHALHERGFGVQGRGLMLGVRLKDPLSASRGLLERGYIAFPAGIHAEVLALTPPVVLSDAQIEGFVTTLADLAEPAA
jgi:4-aminobutyrate aminotransferase-like enzyme